VAALKCIRLFASGGCTKAEMWRLNEENE